MKLRHIPVLLQEVIEGLKIQRGKRYIDATVGFGGHAKEIVKRGGVVLGIEIDRETVEKANLKGVLAVRGSFADIRRIAEKHGFTLVSGILFDLGLSSFHIDSSGRGFSHKRDEPLDMRFDRESSKTTAANLVNEYDENALYTILSSYGEEENSRKITRAIVKSRPIKTTKQLADLIDKVAPRDRGRTKARVFQALRIAVNNELFVIEKALPDAIDLLETGGRIAVISFHSLEDRIVKRLFKSNKKIKMVLKKPILANLQERKNNSRAISAKLRIGEKL